MDIFRSDLQWIVGLIGIFIGIVTGISVNYAKSTSTNALTKKAIEQLENSCKQYQKDLNYIRIEVSQAKVQIQNTDQSYRILSSTLKDVARSIQDVAVALARLEERQEKTDRILEVLGEKINLSLKG